MLIFQCIIGLYSQSVHFANAFAQADIPSWGSVFVELPINFDSDGVQYNVSLRLNKILYGQSESAHLCYEKLRNGLFYSCFMASKVYPCLFIYNTVICVVYVDDCLFW